VVLGLIALLFVVLIVSPILAKFNRESFLISRCVITCFRIIPEKILSWADYLLPFWRPIFLL